VQPRYGGLTAEALSNAAGTLGMHWRRSCFIWKVCWTAAILPKAVPPSNSCAARRSYRAGTWAIVDVDVSDSEKGRQSQYYFARQRILRSVDAHARKQGETRSGFLAEQGWTRWRKPVRAYRVIGRYRPISDGQRHELPAASRRRMLAPNHWEGNVPDIPNCNEFNVRKRRDEAH